MVEDFFDLPNGIPSHDTFLLIEPATFEAAFLSWVGTLVDDFDREVVAIDGKTVRRSFDRGREQNPLHRVSAWASEQGLVLGQCCVDSKSNEITAIPALLEQLGSQEQHRDAGSDWVPDGGGMALLPDQWA